MHINFQNARLARRPYEQYKEKANPQCSICQGAGVYSFEDFCDWTTLVCDGCVPDPWKRHRKWGRVIAGYTYFAILIILSCLFWGWTTILWWRWFHAL